MELIGYLTAVRSGCLIVVTEAWLSCLLDLVEWVAEQFVVLLLVKRLCFNSF